MRQSALWCLVLNSCGPPAAPPAPVELRMVDAAPSRGRALTSELLVVPAPIDRLGANSATFAAGGRVYEFVGGRIERRTLYSAGSDPVTLGSIHAIAPRFSGGAWLAADSGLFIVEGAYVSKSPLPGTAAPVRSATEAQEGLLAGLWLASDSGLYRRTSEAVQRYTLSGAQVLPPRAVAVEAQGSSALAAVGDRLYLLTHLDGKLVSEAAPLEV